MGRSKLPIQVKKLRGTTRKCRDSGHEDSETRIVQLQSVKVPQHLNREAAKIYKEVVKQLFLMEMLEPIDTQALAMYASNYALAVKMQSTLDKDGCTIVEKDESGDVYRVSVNPAFKVMRDAIAIVNTIGSQFGWSPVSRMKLRAIAARDKKKNEFEEYED